MSPSSTSNSSDRSRAGLAALATVGALAVGSVLPLEAMTKNIAGERVAYRAAVFELDQRWVAGSATRTLHAANGQGLRGDVIVGRDTEILIVGGSTAQCGLLDEASSLNEQLARAAREHDAAPIRVAALAQGGLPLMGLLPELEAFTQDERRPTVIVGFFGANEAQTFFNHTPWVSSAPGAPWEAWIDPESALGVNGRRKTYMGWYHVGNHGRFLAAVRDAYADERAWQHELHPAHAPLLYQAMGQYAAGLRELQTLAESRGAKLVLMTQPVAPYAPPANGRGWAPFIYAGPGKGFVPSPALTMKLVEAFNAHTRSFAKEQGVALVDLAATLEGCSECFYDQWHFSASGAARAAEAMIPSMFSTAR